MKSRSLLIFTLAFTVTAAGAFWAGRASVDPATGRAGTGLLRVDSPTAAEAAAAASPLGKSGATAPGGAAGGLAARPRTPEELSEALSAALSDEDPASRMEKFLALLKGIDSSEGMEAALGVLLKDFNPRERGREFSMMMTRWAGLDPDAALTFAKGREDWTGQWAASTVLQSLTKTDPDKAIAWAMVNGAKANETDDGNHYMVGVLTTLAKTDLDRAAELAQTMNRSRARGEAMDKVLDQFFAQRTPAETRQWADGLPEGPFKNGLLTRLAGRLADTDIASTVAWAEGLPDNEARTGVLSEIVQRWAGKEPNEAGEWLNQFPASPATDEPRERFAWSVQEKDPEAAIAWAGTITDESRRTRTTWRLAREWMQREPEAAAAWVNASTLSDEAKQSLLRRRG